MAKPQAGKAYSARLTFGKVPVATAFLSVGCRANLSGALIKGDGAIAGHVATCTLADPGDARGENLVVTVKVSGRHGVALVRHAG